MQGVRVATQPVRIGIRSIGLLILRGAKSPEE